MVKYIVVPWRHREELLLVRQQLYPDKAIPRSTFDGSDYLSSPALPASDLTRQEKRNGQYAAVGRILMWTQRGSTPHLVESTGLLLSTVLSDGDLQDLDSDDAGKARLSTRSAASTWAVRTAYASAFGR